MRLQLQQNSAGIWAKSGNIPTKELVRFLELQIISKEKVSFILCSYLYVYHLQVLSSVFVICLISFKTVLALQNWTKLIRYLPWIFYAAASRTEIEILFTNNSIVAASTIYLITTYDYEVIFILLLLLIVLFYNLHVYITIITIILLHSLFLNVFHSRSIQYWVLN